MPIRPQLIQARSASQTISGWSFKIEAKFSEPINIRKNLVLLFLR